MKFTLRVAAAAYAVVLGVSADSEPTRKQLVAEAHAEEREVESSWKELEAANAKQQALVQKLEDKAKAQRAAGNLTAAKATEEGADRLRHIEGVLDQQMSNMRSMLTRAKPYIPDSLVQKQKKGKKVGQAFLQVSANEAPEDALAKEMTHDLEMNFNKIAPFGKEDTAKELQDHAAKTQDTLVDAVENAEVAEIKRAVFRALTRLRAATIKEFDTIARLETQAIDAYNDAHHYRAENPLAHLHEDEAPVETDKLKSFHF